MFKKYLVAKTSFEYELFLRLSSIPQMWAFISSSCHTMYPWTPQNQGESFHRGNSG